MEKLGSAKMILYESLESDELLELDRGGYKRNELVCSRQFCVHSSCL